jgi:leucine-rich repeat protein SHOC2
LKRLSLACSFTTGNKVLRELPASFANLTALEELYLDKCKVLKNLPVGPWKRLRILHMRECKSITELPDQVGDWISLKEWNMAKCIALTQLPESVGQLQSLEDLVLSKCKSLRSLPSTLGHCSSLVWLDVRGCKRLTELPSSLSQTPLRVLDLGQCKALDTRIPIMASLQELRINWVVSMDLIPSELHDCVVMIESG